MGRSTSNNGNIWVGDFETTNDTPDEARVWFSGMYNIHGEQFQWGKDMEWTLNFWFNHPGVYYYHNLKFDGNFIIAYLLHHGFKHLRNGKMTNRTFKTIISDMGQFYSIEILFKPKLRVVIYDSLKIITLSVAKIAEAFNLPEPKGDIDYDAPRPLGYEPNEIEVDYVRRDCSIVGKGLLYMFNEGLTKMTQGSNAYGRLKDSIPNFRKVFPEFDFNMDKEIRQAYKGGFCYVSKLAQGKDIGAGLVYDKNSMYPSHMRNSPMPYGWPKLFDGMYKYNPLYPLSVQMFSASFTLKPGYLPTVQDKSGLGRFKPTEFIEDSQGPMVLCMTNLDLELFMNHYIVTDFQPFRGWMFQASSTIFQEYVDYWYDVKEKAAKDGNGALKQIAKIMLNSAYGKFGTSPERLSKYPVLGDDDIVHYKLEEEPKIISAEYIPVAIFITAWARYDIINNAQKLYDRFLYADTDSLHLSGLEAPSTLEIDPYKLGAWDCETQFTKARYIKPKTYMEVTKDGKNIVKCAGLPHKMHDLVTWDNFKPGLELEGKLQHRTVKGGVILKPTPFQITI